MSILNDLFLGGGSHYQDTNNAQNAWLKANGYGSTQPNAPYTDNAWAGYDMGADLQNQQQGVQQYLQMLQATDPAQYADVMSTMGQHNSNLGTINKVGSRLAQGTIGAIAGGGLLSQLGMLGGAGGAGGAAGDAIGDAATSAAWGSGAGLGGDTLSAMGMGSALGTAGGGAGNWLTDMLGKGGGSMLGGLSNGQLLGGALSGLGGYLANRNSQMPATPDYMGLAKQQADAATAAANAQTQANRPNQFTPFGSSTWQQDANGKWTNNVTLAGDQQKALNDQMGLQAQRSGLATGMLGAVGDATSKPFDWSGMQAMGATPQVGNLQAGNLEAGGDLGRQRIEDALFARMAPQHAQAQSALEAKLAAMGAARGSEGWNRESQNLGDQQARERFNALEMGGQEQQRQFGMAQQAGQQNFNQQAQAGQQNFNQGLQAGNYQNQMRQQQIGEQQLRRQTPLNELNALMSGQQVQNPTFGSFTNAAQGGTPNLSAAGQNQYNANVGQYNAKQAQNQGLMNGIGGIAGLFTNNWGG